MDEPVYCPAKIIDVDPADKLLTTSHFTAKAFFYEPGQNRKNTALVAKHQRGAQDDFPCLRQIKIMNGFLPGFAHLRDKPGAHKASVFGSRGTFSRSINPCRRAIDPQFWRDPAFENGLANRPACIDPGIQDLFFILRCETAVDAPPGKVNDSIGAFKSKLPVSGTFAIPLDEMDISLTPLPVPAEHYDLLVLMAEFLLQSRTQET
jgi:hypothetical protein